MFGLSWRFVIAVLTKSRVLMKVAKRLHILSGNWSKCEFCLQQGNAESLKRI